MKRPQRDDIITIAQYSRSELTTLIGSRSLGKGVVEADSAGNQEVSSSSSSSRVGGRHGDSQQVRAIARKEMEGGGGGGTVMSAGHGGRQLSGERHRKR